MTNNKKIVAFVGLAGTGKTTAVDYLTKKGYPKVYGGGIFYEEMKKAGIQPTQENENEFRFKIHSEKGNDYISSKFISQIHDLLDAGQHHIVTDSNYSWNEYKAIKHEFPGELYVIALLTPRHIRHHRLLTRIEHPLAESESNERDWREIEDLQAGGTIAIADHYIMNDGSLDNLYNQIDQILNDIEFYN